MKIICNLKRIKLKQVQIFKLKNSLWKRWEILNNEYQSFSHKKILNPLLKNKKKQLEIDLREIESLLNILDQKNVFLDKL